jgi:protein arginine kinase activator
MKCQSCPSPATLHITEVIKGAATEHHFCEECAQVYLNQVESKGGEMAAGEPADADSESGLEELNQLTCPNCGITFKEFRKQGRLGCPHDYVAFQDELLPLLESIHGSTEHKGKVPRHTPEDSRKQYRLIKLRGELKSAVAEESYERAAKIRDEIHSLEQESTPPHSERDVE